MTWLERMDPTRTWSGFLWAAGLGFTALFVFLEPAPTHLLNPPTLVAFWGLHVFIALALCQAWQILITRRLAPRANPWLAIGAAGVAASAVMTPLAQGLDLWIVEPVDPGEAYAWSLAELIEEWLNLGPPVTLVWLGLNAARFLRLPQDPARPNPAEADGRAAPDFLRRLAPGRRSELVALSAELHYLRVYTTLGDSLILQGFGEALEQLGPDAGLRIHRSHWIDPRFVEDVSREGGRTHVRLVNGVVLPVARSRRGAVAATLNGVGAPAQARPFVSSAALFMS